MHPLPLRSLAPWLVAGASCVAVGCADNPVATTVVTLESAAPPLLVAVRHEPSSAWESLKIDGRTTFTIEVTGPYQVVVVCNDDVTRVVSVAQYARTPEDTPLIEAECVAAEPFRVSGAIQQPGQVSLGRFLTLGASANWRFRIPVSADAHDLVIRSQDHRIAIRRDLQITGDLELGAIDLDQEGAQAMVPTTFTATNLLPNESASSWSSLDVGGTVASFFPAGGWGVRLAPKSVLRPTDHQTVELVALSPRDSGGSSLRIVRRDAHIGDPTEVTLPEPLGAIAFEMTPTRLSARWTEFSAYDSVMLSRDSAAADHSLARHHSLVLTRAFIEATGATDAALDFGEIPGFQSQWQHDPANEGWRTFSAVRGASRYDSASSEVFEHFARSGARVTVPADIDALRTLGRHRVL